jgi:acyl-CoA oxidase
LETLVNLVYYKEVAEIKSMTEVLQKKLLEEGRKFYDVWMHELSDDIQALALAFSERFSLENALAAASAVKDPQAKEVLSKAIRLHCISHVKENLGWYLANGIVSAKAGLALDAEYQAAVKALVPHVNDILEGFNIPRIPQLAPPIIRDYVKFNE